MRQEGESRKLISTSRVEEPLSFKSLEPYGQQKKNRKVFCKLRLSYHGCDTNSLV